MTSHIWSISIVLQCSSAVAQNHAAKKIVIGISRILNLSEIEALLHKFSKFLKRWVSPKRDRPKIVLSQKIENLGHLWGLVRGGKSEWNADVFLLEWAKNPFWSIPSTRNCDCAGS